MRTVREIKERLKIYSSSPKSTDILDNIKANEIERQPSFESMLCADDIRCEKGHPSDCLFSSGKGWRWAERGKHARNHEVWAFMAKDLQHVSAYGMHFPVKLRGKQEMFFGSSSNER